MFPVRWRVGEVQITWHHYPLSTALLCSSFPPSLFSNDVISSIINHLAATVDESNPLNLPWEQPQGRRQVSRKYIKDNADRHLRQVGGMVSLLHTGHFPSAGICYPMHRDW